MNSKHKLILNTNVKIYIHKYVYLSKCFLTPSDLQETVTEDEQATKFHPALTCSLDKGWESHIKVSQMLSVMCE